MHQYMFVFNIDKASDVKRYILFENIADVERHLH